ncbi:Acetate kinase [Seminavis robusta]|uniref:Probable acetate kinase n=1 Tax=Seminavis robusta TaxID=568900 RepID=A0A9N8DYA4_9STRA|nr:Acetate kinase [Seminavis robusta]|eukprot:Sro338_g120800.1 Acetate kinase (1144) ;mRNA; f:11603-15138
MQWSQVLLRASARRVRPSIKDGRFRNLQTLTLNAGSTTLKYALYDIDDQTTSASSKKATLLASGLVDKVGKPDASITHNKQVVPTASAIDNHVDALDQVLQILLQSEQTPQIDCIGHRVVHGGPTFTSPTLLTPTVMDELQSISNLAPLHNPPALAAIQASLEQFPTATQVAIFDTAFHVASLPPKAYRYAVPQEWYHDHHIRKYGFHGTSYSYVAEQTARHLQKPVEECNLIVLHLGGGASMCCIQNGKSIDTTMGLTPLEGLVMATRAGDVDVGMVDYLVNSQNLTLDQVMQQLNRQSGLLGLSGGVSSDMRVLRDDNANDENCQLARQVFAERCRKYLGAYYFKLQGRVDAIVFCGGIGEGDAPLRQMILDGLEQDIGIAVDNAKNAVAVAPDRIVEVHPALAKTKVLVYPTDEEVSIALQASSLVAATTTATPKPTSTTATTPKPMTQATTNLFCHSLGHTYTGPQELGLLRIFAATINKVGYFRPIGRGGVDDYRIALMKQHFGWTDDEEQAMYGVDEEEAWELLAAGRDDELFERILQKYLAYAATKEFVMVSSFTQEDDSLHFAAKLCSALNIPAIMIGDADHDSQLSIAQTAFDSHGANCSGVIVSNVTDESAQRKKLEQMNLQPVALLPPNPVLENRTMREAMNLLEDSVCLYGAEHLESTMDSMRIYTVQVDDMLDLIVDDELAIVNCRRVDTLMSILLAAQSSKAPTPAGILFTLYQPGDLSPKIAALLDGLRDIRIPILATSMDTIDAANILDSTPPFLTAQSQDKIHEAAATMETHLDYNFLDQFRDDDDNTQQRDIGPRMFQYSTFLKARKLQKTIVLPEGADPRVVEAATILVKRQLCKVILVGDPVVIQANAEARRVSLDGITVVNPQSYAQLDDMIDAFVEARKSKGLTPVEAKEYLLQDVNYFSTMMMHLGLADGMVSGAMHSSANTIRPALQILKTAPGASLVSSIFFMLLEDGVKVFGDCAINTMPNAEQLAEIAVSSAKTSQQFGIEPRVGLLSYATGDSNKGELIDKVITATKSAKAAAEKEGFMNPELIAGPLQFDAAVDPAVAAVKAKDSPVAGKANVLIFPDLNSGNNGYKAVQQASKTIAVGPILQGLRKPVNDLSRGATVDDIVNTAVITALQTEN